MTNQPKAALEVKLPERPTPVLYLDIDGTVREGKDDALGRFVNGPDDVVVFPEAAEQMKLWKQAGGRIVGVSNEGGIALGIVQQADVVAAFRKTAREVDRLTGMVRTIDKLTFCHHHPDADNLDMARCWCRKPKIGGVIQALLNIGEKFHELYPPWMGLCVGDMASDEQLAANLDVDFVWAKDWRAGRWEMKKEEADGG